MLRRFMCWLVGHEYEYDNCYVHGRYSNSEWFEHRFLCKHCGRVK